MRPIKWYPTYNECPKEAYIPVPSMTCAAPKSFKNTNMLYMCVFLNMEEGPGPFFLSSELWHHTKHRCQRQVEVHHNLRSSQQN